MAEDLNKAATALYLESDFEGAYKGYSKAMKADPTNTKYITNRAQASIRAGRPDLAIADSTMAISLDSNNPKGFVKRATAYQMKHQYELAIKDWNEALRLSPEDEKIAASQDECRVKIIRTELNVNAAQEQASMNISFENKTRVAQLGLTPEDLMKLLPSNWKTMRDGFGLVIQAHQAREADPPQIENAVELYLAAGKEGNAEGWYNAAVMCPLYFPERQREALSWFQKAAKMSPYLHGNLERIGVREAFNSLGVLYRDGTYGEPISPSKAFDYFQQSAQLNFPSGMNNLGHCYDTGFGTARDYLKALEWYEKAGEIGFPTSQFNASCIYFEGRPGVPVDIAKGKKWLQMAVDQKLPSALQYAANTNFSGNSYKSLLTAAEAGDVFSMYNLGRHHQLGLEGVPKDPEAARKWYIKASNRGMPDASFNLSLMYLEGESGIEKDLAKAFKYVERAAQTQHAKAAFLLHKFYLFGDGVPKPDLKKAQMWLDVAIKCGFPVENKLQFTSVEELEECMASVSEWEKRNGLNDQASLSNTNRVERYITAKVEKNIPQEFSQLFRNLTASMTPRHDTEPAPSKSIDTFSSKSLMRYPPSPTRDFLLDVRRNFEVGLYEFYRNQEVHNDLSIRLLSNAMTREPLACSLLFEVHLSLQKALVDYTETFPNNDAAISLQGIFLFIEESVEKAIHCIETAFKLKPLCEYAELLANLCLNLNQYEEAITWANRALELLPTSISSYYARGYAYMSLKRKEEAKVDFIKYLKIASKEARKRASVFYQLAVISMLQNKEYDEVCRYFHLGEEAEKECFPLYDSGDIGSKHLVALTVKMMESSAMKPSKSMNAQNIGVLEVTDICVVCGLKETSLKVCSQCGKVQYCSKHCQLKHWKSGHKLECKKD